MKPTKNQIFCIGCNRKKMLFESNSKADNFIKFNRGEIESRSSKTPTRSYYCSFCCGWHVTSIEEKEIGISRDKRDEKLWERIKTSNRSYEIGSSELPKKLQDINTINKKKRIPRTQNGIILNVICGMIRRLIAEIEKALYRADINTICSLFEELKVKEYELRSKSKEFDIDVKELDKRYEEIDNIRNRFLYLCDFFTDDVKRKSHLESLNEEEKSHGDNIIISNIELICTINAILNAMDLINAGSNEKQKYKSGCEVIVNELIPQLQGPTRKLKDFYRNKINQILYFLTI